jgi:hypothetical protein
MDVSTIGLDVAKSVFQVHGIDAAGQVSRCFFVAHNGDMAPKLRLASVL